jgi:hypothetical protein
MKTGEVVSVIILVASIVSMIAAFVLTFSENRQPVRPVNNVVFEHDGNTVVSFTHEGNRCYVITPNSGGPYARISCVREK